MCFLEINLLQLSWSSLDKLNIGCKLKYMRMNSGVGFLPKHSETRPQTDILTFAVWVCFSSPYACHSCLAAGEKVNLPAATLQTYLPNFPFFSPIIYPSIYYLLLFIKNPNKSFPDSQIRISQ